MKDLSNYIEFTRINNDVNGNPRVVCHFLAFKPLNNSNEYIPFSYDEALVEGRKLGGIKFHNKQYGGGIVFQCYNTNDLAEKILLSTGDAVTYNREPTAYELKMGYGALHYRTFLKKEVTNKEGNLKKWFKTDDDKLNYRLG